MGSIRFLLIVAFGVGAGMFLVWQRAGIRKVSYECASLQRRALQLEEENRRLFSDVCALKTPQIIGSKTHSMELGLAEQGGAGTLVSEGKAEKKERSASAAVATLHRGRGKASAPHRQ